MTNPNISLNSLLEKRWSYDKVLTPMSGDFIPLTDLKAQYLRYRDELRAAMDASLDRMDFILGKEVGLFEEDFARFIGVPHAVSCANGTDALVLALKALDIGPGDEVITTPYTWISTVFA